MARKIKIQTVETPVQHKNLRDALRFFLQPQLTLESLELKAECY